MRQGRLCRVLTQTLIVSDARFTRTVHHTKLAVETAPRSVPNTYMAVVYVVSLFTGWMSCKGVSQRV